MRATAESAGTLALTGASSTVKTVAAGAGPSAAITFAGLSRTNGGGVVTSYCHNDELLVGGGDHVRRGQMIARSGNTGRSTGPHLHYQLDLGGEPVDPLRFRAQRPKTAVGASD